MKDKSKMMALSNTVRRKTNKYIVHHFAYNDS